MAFALADEPTADRDPEGEAAAVHTHTIAANAPITARVGSEVMRSSAASPPRLRESRTGRLARGRHAKAAGSASGRTAQTGAAETPPAAETRRRGLQLGGRPHGPAAVWVG